MEKEEAYERLDKYDFTNILMKLYWGMGLDNVSDLRWEIPHSAENGDSLAWALYSLKDEEVMEYFEDRYKVKFKKHVMYSVDIIDYDEQSSLKNKIMKGLI